MIVKSRQRIPLRPELKLLTSYLLIVYGVIFAEYLANLFLGVPERNKEHSVPLTFASAIQIKAQITHQPVTAIRIRIKDLSEHAGHGVSVVSVDYPVSVDALIEILIFHGGDHLAIHDLLIYQSIRWDIVHDYGLSASLKYQPEHLRLRLVLQLRFHLACHIDKHRTQCDDSLFYGHDRKADLYPEISPGIHIRKADVTHRGLVTRYGLQDLLLKGRPILWNGQHHVVTGISTHLILGHIEQLIKAFAHVPDSRLIPVKFKYTHTACQIVKSLLQHPCVIRYLLAELLISAKRLIQFHAEFLCIFFNIYVIFHNPTPLKTLTEDLYRSILHSLSAHGYR